jgi:superfamily II DNA/RNA helicase
MALIIGGVGMGDQEKLLDKGVDVLIATPGRLLDWFERGKVMLTHVQIIVIDEADRMLDMGFIPDVERIVSKLHKREQTLLFSATMPAEVRRLADRFLTDPAVVEVARPATPAASVDDVVVGVDADRKRGQLARLLKQEGVGKAIIFCNRKREVAILHKSLQKHGFSVGALHGDMDQPARMAALDQFRRGEASLLIASDVAARGLDIPDVSHVINFDVPHHADDYVHRVGRTGRAGRAGTAITIVSPADRKAVAAIEKLTGQALAWASAPPAAEEQARRERPHGERPRGERSRGERGRRSDRPQRREREPAPVAHLDDSRPRPKREPQRPRVEESDSHLPAFLLRPFSVKAS